MDLSRLYKNKKPLILFLVPSLLFMVLFLYYPFVQNIINSFLHITGLGTAADGLNVPWYQNYSRILQDPHMHTALKNTFLMLLLTVIFQVGLALVLALLVDSITVGASFFRTVYFFPIIISATALGLLFNLIFLYDGGMINNLLLTLGRENIVDWKDETHYLFTMSVPVIWQYVGFYFVIILTGLKSIPSEVYEAAEIDGANEWGKIRYVKMPLLQNTLSTCLVLAITGALKIFDLPYTMFPQGMPMDKSWLMGTYMYHQTFLMTDVDYGSTIAVIIVVIGVLLSRLSQCVFKPKN